MTVDTLKRINTPAWLLITMVLIASLMACQNNSEQDSESLPSHQFALTQQQLDKIDSICRDFLGKGNTVGFSIGLSHNGEVIFAKGYGLANIDSKKSATDSTIYPIASVSKFILAVATMKMIEDGKLALTDKVADHLPEFPRQQYMTEITVEHLLRHTSGLVDYEDWFDDIFINQKRVYTEAEFYAFLDQPLFFKPGSHYSYSNSGYAILSRILERVNNSTFNEVLQNYINKPLGLETVGVWPLLWDHPAATMGYELVEGKIDTSLHMMTKAMKGDGGLGASVLDLLKVMKGVTNSKLISDTSLQTMLSPTPLDGFTIDSGLGAKCGIYNGEYTFGHSGGFKGTGWANLTHYSESGITFAAAMNTNYSPEEIWTLRHLIMPVVFNIDPPQYKTSPIANKEKYVGDYLTINRWGNAPPAMRVVYVKGDSLFWDNPATAHPGAQLFQIGENRFSWQAFPFDEFKFHEVDGTIVACSEYLDGMFGGVRMKSK